MFRRGRLPRPRSRGNERAVGPARRITSTSLFHGLHFAPTGPLYRKRVYAFSSTSCVSRLRSYWETTRRASLSEIKRSFQDHPPRDTHCRRWMSQIEQRWSWVNTRENPITVILRLGGNKSRRDYSALDVWRFFFSTYRRVVRVDTSSRRPRLMTSSFYYRISGLPVPR